MKKPLNYRLQMYRALVEKMCTNCWFWCIFCGFTLFFVCIRGFCTGHGQRSVQGVRQEKMW